MKIKSFLILAVILLAGCIDVDDLGAYWDKGTVDPVLEGRWKMTPAPGVDTSSSEGDKYYIFKKTGDHYVLEEEVDKAEDDNDDMLVKTLESGGHKFMMLYEPRQEAEAVKPGSLWPYKIEGDKIEFRRIAAAQVGEMERITENIIAAEAMGGTWTFKIPKLDEPSLEALAKVSNAPDLWEIWATGEKIQAEKTEEPK